MDKDPILDRRSGDEAQIAVEVMRVATEETDENPNRSVRIKVAHSKGKKGRRKRAPLEGFTGRSL